MLCRRNFHRDRLLRPSLALDQILLAQAAFDGKNVALAHERLEQVPLPLRKWEWYYLNAVVCRLSLPRPTDKDSAAVPGHYFTLFGHKDSVIRLNWSPDGRRLLSYDEAGTVVGWDLTEEKDIFRFQVGKD